MRKTNKEEFQNSGEGSLWWNGGKIISHLTDSFPISKQLKVPGASVQTITYMDLVLCKGTFSGNRFGKS